MAQNIAFILPTGDRKEQELPFYLHSLGYNTNTMAIDAIHKNTFANQPKTDLLLGDFRIANNIQQYVASIKNFPQFSRIPTILLTSSSENQHLKFLLSLKPDLILYAPVNKTELTVNIDILINNDQQETIPPSSKATDAVYIQKDLTHHKILKGSITYVEAEGSYCSINTVEGACYRMSLNLKQFINQLDDPYFIRISRKHVINARHVTKIQGDQIFIKNNALKMTKSRKKQVMSNFKVLRSG